MKEKRATLKKKISKLEAKRKEYVFSHKPSKSEDLGSVIVKSIKEQAVSNGFKFKK